VLAASTIDGRTRCDAASQNVFQSPSSGASGATAQAASLAVKVDPTGLAAGDGVAIEAFQLGAHQRGGEMLDGDGHLAGRPKPPDLRQRRNEQV